VVESGPGSGVHLGTEEVELRTHLLCCLAGQLDFEALVPELEVKAESVVGSQGRVVQGQSYSEDNLPGVPIVLNPVGAALLQ
jgi:hypothetical protein